MKHIMQLAAVFALASFGVSLKASPLTGSGNNLILNPATNIGAVAPGIAPALTVGTTSFSGTWSTGVDAAWLGTFSGAGAYPSSGFTGTTRWDFTNLAAQLLPSGTYFRLGDLDGGGESLILRAYGANSALIQTPWLEDAFFQSSANPAELIPGTMPGWSWDGVLFQYTFAGGNINCSCNPTVTASLATNAAMAFLEIDKADTNYGFGIAAPSPVPEPGTFVLGGLGLLLTGWGARRRNSD